MSYTREQIELLAQGNGVVSTDVLRQLLAENDALRKGNSYMENACSEFEARIIQLTSENDALREDAARWRYARTILAIEHIEDAVKLCSGGIPEEVNNLRADQSIDAARHSVHAAVTGEEVKEQSNA